MTAMTSEQNETVESTGTAIKMAETFLPSLTTGIPFYLTRDLTSEHIDVLYVTAYNFYSQEKYKEALLIFEAMAFYNHLDKRGWMGAAASAQKLQRYEEAISSYASAALLDAEDPMPAFHTFDCYLALKKDKEALAALEAVLLLSAGKPQYADLEQKARRLKETLQMALGPKS